MKSKTLAERRANIIRKQTTKHEAKKSADDTQDRSFALEEELNEGVTS